MAIGYEKKITEWKPISGLRPIEKNISGFGYNKEFIDANNLRDKKFSHETNCITGQVNFYEPLEVKEEGGEVYFRENDGYVYMDVPETFKTQFGTFNNHNNGEFLSWLGREDYAGLSEKDKEMPQLFGRGDFYIIGNFCDMFDCGEYSYAVSNLMHMGLGSFKIVRIDKNLEAVTIYDNSSEKGLMCLEYKGRFQNEQGHIIIASGFVEEDRGQTEERNFQDKTILFLIDSDGECIISKEWGVEISSSNSIAVIGDFVYFGQNKMVTRLNISSGELAYFTNKNDDELAALTPM